MLNQYSVKRCIKCPNRAVGFFWDLENEKMYYCNTHFNARKYAEDKKQEAQELQQWGDQEWYQKAFPEKFKDIVEVQPKNTQISLFNL